MAGGPLLPVSITYGTNGNVYPGVYVGSTNSRLMEVHGIVIASLGTGTAEVWLLFDTPDASLPSGTCKARLRLMANATSGAAYVAAEWASVVAGDTPDTITLNSEQSATLMHTWASGDDDEWIEYEITLDADTPVAGESIYLHLTFGNTASHNLAAIMGFLAAVVWE